MKKLLHVVVLLTSLIGTAYAQVGDRGSICVIIYLKDSPISATWVGNEAEITRLGLKGWVNDQNLLRWFKSGGYPQCEVVHFEDLDKDCLLFEEFCPGN